MGHITVENSVRDLFASVHEPTEIQDRDGHVLGQFVPTMPDLEATYEKAKALFDPDKTRRILENERGLGRPLSEILMDLNAKGTPQ